ncbi:maleylacetoacetate isomerase [Janthinobacterium fluminis]|uniref:Maleylacetoacetate isomerase n=1 Tax=Janthinobacterium fluminis TaxID=2987524 RepID=A0ABT5JTE1_9BURK|nr:maleylacetoacetate isomerase [Janthinobacterium fluminis]MDC8756020.1 maleylacetoacetate isomerase [Janthinobacterium fluminis]
MKLYTYFRSSAAYRVRIGLNLKGLPYEAVPVHLLRGGGEQLQDSYRSVNPAALIPSLQDGGATLTQSLAILEYLDEIHPGAPLLPADALGRARVRALALTVAADTHPLTNLRVLKYLKHTLGVSDEVKMVWYRHWLAEGLATLEALLAGNPGTGEFCHGDTPTLADCCLEPQAFNAERFELDLAAYPTVARIHARCAAHPAFIAAHPARQPDAE